MTKTSPTLPASALPLARPSAAVAGKANAPGDSAQGDSRALEPRPGPTLPDRNNGLDTAPTSPAESRRPDGTFGPGNPGRPRGSRNRSSQAALALIEGEGEALTRKAVELALAGDTTALRLCLERLCPPRKDAPIAFDLPPLRSARDAADAVQAVVAAVSRGEITPQEGTSVVALVDAYRCTLELTEIEERVAELEAAVRGAT